ncbi:MAG: hypothetical protein IPN36_00605 [Bacteroidetes bacterium]|nr:hypothetical protein [Bacteroidota bacterium]
MRPYFILFLPKPEIIYLSSPLCTFFRNLTLEMTAGSSKILFLTGLLLLGIQYPLRAQYFLVSKVYDPNGDENAIYSVEIRNSSNDSILVLHTQEAALPPFINLYKWEENKSNGKEITLYLGKSNNPFLPEKYRATKTLPPKGRLELYFKLPTSFNDQQKQLSVYFSMLHQKYYTIFHGLETKGTNAAFKKCRSLKEKKGIVHHRKVSF